MPVVINGTTGVNTDGQGNLTFSGTGQRITGDLSTATLANRLFFQNSVANAASDVGVIPNGTSQTANFTAFGSSSDQANTTLMRMGVAVDTGTTYINSFRTGTGSFLPIAFSTGGSERMRLDTSGNLLVNTTTNTNNSRVVVNGVIESTSGGIRFPDGSTQTAAASSAANRFIRYTPGTYTFTVPAGVTSVYVVVIGGGGGGVRYTDAYGTGTRDGRTGGFGQRWITGLTPGQTITVTVGSGGTPVASTSPAPVSGSGGTSSFGAFVTATGGPGFSWNNESVVGTATVSGADIVFTPGRTFNTGAAISNPSAGSSIPGGFAGNAGLVVVQF